MSNMKAQTQSDRGAKRTETTMSAPIFETFWRLSDGRELNDLRAVSKAIVEDGLTAVEVSAESQAKAWELQQAQQVWHGQALDRYNRLAQEQAFRKSPEGRAAAARRDAAEHGSRVTVCGSHDATPFDELDQYGPDATNVFKS